MPRDLRIYAFKQPPTPSYLKRRITSFTLQEGNGGNLEVVVADWVMKKVRMRRKVVGMEGAIYLLPMCQCNESGISFVHASVLIKRVHRMMGARHNNNPLSTPTTHYNSCAVALHNLGNYSPPRLKLAL